MKEKTKVYFAHPISMYNTPEEVYLINGLTKMGAEVINPNDPKLEEEYNRRKKEDPSTAMNVFFEQIEECSKLCAFPTENGKYTAGVQKEILHALKCGIPVTMMGRNVKFENIITDLDYFQQMYAEKCMSVEETCEYLKPYRKYSEKTSEEDKIFIESIVNQLEADFLDKDLTSFKVCLQEILLGKDSKTAFKDFLSDSSLDLLNEKIKNLK